LQVLKENVNYANLAFHTISIFTFVQFVKDQLLFEILDRCSYDSPAYWSVAGSGSYQYQKGSQNV